MAAITLAYDWSELLGTLEQHIVAGIKKEMWPALFPNTLKRVESLAQHGTAIWREKATKIPGQEGRPLKLNPYVALSPTNYAASIVDEPMDDDPTGLGYVVGSREEQALFIETGTPEDQHPMDLHSVLSHAPKARQGKNGKYLRIPLRQPTTEPGGMSGQRFQASSATFGNGVLPPGVVRAMRKKNQYLITGRYQEPSIHPGGGMVARYRYSKNPGRLTLAEINRISERSKHAITPAYAKRIVGLLRGGSKGHNQYLTIRTLSEANPDGWRIKAYPPQQVSEAVAQELINIVDSGTYFRESMQADAQHIATIVGGMA